MSKRLCNRTVCRQPGASWWNPSTLAYYCKSCAVGINRHNPGLCVPENSVPVAALAHTFQINYSPNCPAPFEARFVGQGRGFIDGLSVRETKDRIGYGRTIAEALTNAMPREQSDQPSEKGS